MVDGTVFRFKPDVAERQRMDYGKAMSFKIEICSGNPDYAKSERRANPLRLVYTGDTATDVMWSQYSEPIVTPQVVTEVERSAIRGCYFLPVELENTLGDSSATDMLEMAICGWGGTAPKSSGVQVMEECSYCGRRVFSAYSRPELVFDSASWDEAFVARTVGTLPEGAQVVTIGKSGGELYALTSRTFSGVQTYAPQTAQDAARAAFR
jgi:hypothetical protein